MIHPLLKRHLEAARKEIEHNMKGLQEALEIIEKTLGEPKPLPEPKGKPDLMEMAKEMAKETVEDPDNIPYHHGGGKQKAEEVKLP